MCRPLYFLRKDWKNSQVCLSNELPFIGLSMLKYSIVQKSSWDGNITAKKFLVLDLRRIRLFDIMTGLVALSFAALSA